MSQLTEPRVTCVMLVANRPEMAKQAVAAFRSQTYDPARRELLIYETGDPKWFFDGSDSENEGVIPAFADAGKTIGELRNNANTCTVAGGIIIHFDSDDYSHPNRIAEQVSLLQSSGADCVGYNQMLLWREPVIGEHGGSVPGPQGSMIPAVYEKPGESWLYTGAPKEPLGTSLCYWRRTWERKPFQPTSQGEDAAFVLGLNVAATSAMDHMGAVRIGENLPADCFDVRMIARIHAGNTSNAYTPKNMARQEWKRMPAWDEYCSGVFA